MNHIEYDKKFFLKAFLALSFVACANCSDSLSGQVDPSQCVLRQSVIYGEPNLDPVTMINTTRTQRTALMSEVALLKKDFNVNYITNQEINFLCEDELLATEPVMAFCSGVRLSANVVVTAHHCLEQLPCNKLKITSTFDLPKNSVQNFTTCKHVIWKDSELDVALIITEDDPTEGIAPLEFAHIEQVTKGFLVSHPLGTSTKVDTDVLVRPGSFSDTLWAKADAFSGSSGGGVFSEDGRLIGLLVSGLGDFRWDNQSECMRHKISRSEGFERVVAASTLVRRLCEDTGLLCSVDVWPSPLHRIGIQDLPLSLDKDEPNEDSPVISSEELEMCSQENLP